MKTTLTEFQRNFRKAREAADSGDAVIVKGTNGDYVFARQSAVSGNPFVDLEGVFGAVKLPRKKSALRGKVRSTKRYTWEDVHRAVFPDGPPGGVPADVKEGVRAYMRKRHGLRK